MDASDYALQVTRPYSVAGFFPRSGTEYQPPTRQLRTAYTPSNAPLPATRAIVAVNSMYKTDICRKFISTGTCKYGDTCIFAHGTEEMRNLRLMNGNTTVRAICKYSRRMCPYGRRCIFTHKRFESYEEKREDLPRGDCISSQSGGPGDVDSRSKTRLCNNWSMVNSCTYGSKCNFAHGHADLRSAPALASEFGNAWVTPTAVLVKDTLPNEAQKATALKQKLSPRVCLFKWKKINKMVGIYADWIDEESFVPCLGIEH